MKTKVIKLLNKFKNKNHINSSLTVCCVKAQKCDSRHSQLCENCLYNVIDERGSGISYFRPKDS